MYEVSASDQDVCRSHSHSNSHIETTSLLLPILRLNEIVLRIFRLKNVSMVLAFNTGFLTYFFYSK